MPRSPSPSSYLLALALLLILPIEAAWGETINSDRLGLSFDVPNGTRLTGTAQQGQSPFLLLREGSEQPTWSLRLERAISKEETARNLLLSLVQPTKEAPDSLEVLHMGKVAIGDVIAEETWIKERLENGKDLVFGWLVIPAGTNTYIIASVVTLPGDLEETRATMGPVFSSFRIQDPTDLVADRQTMLKRGQEFLKSLTEADLRNLVDYSQLRRIYRPSNGLEGDTEVGYSLLKVMAAPRGTIKRHRKPENYSKEEQEEGLLVIEHSRIIADASRKIYFDMLSLQWVSWDLQREAWTIVATRRQGEAHMTENEVGFRTEPSLGSPRARLHVIKQDDDIGLRQPYEWVVPDGWLPRPLAGLLSRLVPQQQQSYAFITYDHTGSTPSLALRTDAWTADASLPNRWNLESRIGEQGLPARATYDRNANLLRLVQPSGNIIEPSTVDDIQQRWDRAGLETK